MPLTSRGFSFIEMGIAIFILGAIFLMTLKGSDMVMTMRAFIAANQIEQFRHRIAAYHVENRALPGDDTGAPRRFGRESAVFLRYGRTVSLAGDEKIDGRLSDSTNAAGENFMVWRDLRYAGALEGDPAIAGASAMPENPFGGVYGIDEGNLGHTTQSLCATRVPGRAAALIDQRLDDGIVDKGKVVGTAAYDVAGAFNHFEKPDSQPYDVDKQYIICIPAMP